jgi:4-azaleucine resistance transporter AzlC
VTSDVPETVADDAPMTAAERRAIVKMSLSIAVSLIPFGLAFGVLCRRAGLSWIQALGFSSFVFTGGSQFAAVGVLAENGSAGAAIAAGLLLSIRSLVYGLMMAPTLTGPWWYRAATSQLMIDESIAVGTSYERRAPRRFGYIIGGLSVFVFWNITTVLGAVVLGSDAAFTKRWGLDVAVPAAFIALLWPRLKVAEQRHVAIVGALIAVVLVPFVKPGLPIVAAAAAALLVLFPRTPHRRPTRAAQRNTMRSTR